MFIEEIINDRGWSLDLNEKVGFLGSATQIYYVQIRTKNSPLQINLFRFIDEGRWNCGIGIFFKDKSIEPEAPQKEKANSYARMLSAYTGFELWRDRNVHFNFDPDNLHECANCGHRIGLSVKRCTYCGYNNA